MQDWTHWGQVFYDPPHVSSQPQGDFMLSGSPSGKGNSPRLAALLLFGKWNFDLLKSTVKALIQRDLGLPWGNFGSNCVKVLLAEAIPELFEYIPGGEQAVLWKNWSKSYSEREATTTEWGTMGKGKRIAQHVSQNSETVFFLSLFSPPPAPISSCLLAFFWRTGFTHFSWNRLL